MAAPTNAATAALPATATWTPTLTATPTDPLIATATPTPPRPLEHAPDPPFGHAELTALGGTLRLVPGAPLGSRVTTAVLASVSTNASQGYALKLMQSPAEHTASSAKPIQRSTRAPHMTIAGIFERHGSHNTSPQPAPLGTTIADADAPPPPGEARQIEVELVFEADFNVPPGEYKQELRLVFQPRFGPRRSPPTTGSSP